VRYLVKVTRKPEEGKEEKRKNKSCLEEVDNAGSWLYRMDVDVVYLTGRYRVAGLV